MSVFVLPGSYRWCLAQLDKYRPNELIDWMARDWAELTHTFNHWASIGTTDCPGAFQISHARATAAITTARQPNFGGLSSSPVALAADVSKSVPSEAFIRNVSSFSSIPTIIP